MSVSCPSLVPALHIYTDITCMYILCRTVIGIPHKMASWCHSSIFGAQTPQFKIWPMTPVSGPNRIHTLSQQASVLALASRDLDTIFHNLEDYSRARFTTFYFIHGILNTPRNLHLEVNIASHKWIKKDRFYSRCISTYTGENKINNGWTLSMADACCDHTNMPSCVIIYRLYCWNQLVKIPQRNTMCHLDLDVQSRGRKPRTSIIAHQWLTWHYFNHSLYRFATLRVMENVMICAPGVDWDSGSLLSATSFPQCHREQAAYGLTRLFKRHHSCWAPRDARDRGGFSGD